MSSSPRIHNATVEAIGAGKHVDITGARLSGRSTVLRKISAELRERGWDVVDVAGAAGSVDSVPTRDVPDMRLLVVDDWDRLDEQSQQLLTTRADVLVTARVGGNPPMPGMVSLEMPRVDPSELRVALTRIAGVVLSPEDATALAGLTDGAIGAAVGVVISARERGSLVVSGGHGKLSGLWVDAAGPVVEALLRPLSPGARSALESAASGGGISSASAAELSLHGYFRAGEVPEVSSSLLRAWFTRA